VNQLPGGQLIPIADRTEANKNLGMWAQDENYIYLPDERGHHPRYLPGNTNRDSGRVEASVTGSTDGSFIQNHKHYSVVDKQKSQNGFPALVSAVLSMIKSYSKNDGGGKESTYLAGDGDAPTISPTSNPISGTRSENTVLTVGQVGGVFI